MSSLYNSHNNPCPQILVNARIASKALNISEKSLWNMTTPRGPIPFVRIGKKGVRYAVSDLQRFVESRKEL